MSFYDYNDFTDTFGSDGYYGDGERQVETEEEEFDDMEFLPFAPETSTTDISEEVAKMRFKDLERVSKPYLVGKTPEEKFIIRFNGSNERIMKPLGFYGKTLEKFKNTMIDGDGKLFYMNTDILTVALMYMHHNPKHNDIDFLSSVSSVKITKLLEKTGNSRMEILSSDVFRYIKFLI